MVQQHASNTYLNNASVQTGSWCCGSGLSDIAWQVQVVVDPPGPLILKVDFNVCLNTFVQGRDHMNKRTKMHELGDT